MLACAGEDFSVRGELCGRDVTRLQRFRLERRFRRFLHDKNVSNGSACVAGHPEMRAHAPVLADRSETCASLAKVCTSPMDDTDVATSCSGSTPPMSSDDEPHALRALLSSYARHLRSLQVLQVAGWHALETCRLKCEQHATKSRLGHKKAAPPTCIPSLPQPRRRPQHRRTSPQRLRPHAVNERLDSCDLDSDDDGLEPLPMSESGVRHIVCGKKKTKTLRARARCARPSIKVTD